MPKHKLSKNVNLEKIPCCISIACDVPNKPYCINVYIYTFTYTHTNVYLEDLKE
jgi:hypothetical protein